MARNVTIYDIAKAAGVSPSTVSRALSKPGRLSARTELKIHRVAEELGYLTAGKDDILESPSTGLVSIMVSGFDNPHNMRLLSALETRLEERGYAAVCSDATMDNNIKRRTSSLLLRNVDGVVLISPTINEPDLRRFAINRPTVLVNQQLSGLSTISVDSSDAIDQAMRMLRQSGHRSVTFLAGSANSWVNEMRRRALKASAYRYDLEFRVLRGFPAVIESGKKAVDGYLCHPSDAVFAYNDQLAIGFESALRARGLRVPDDVSIVSFDNDPASTTTLPPLTTIDQHADVIGVKAADTIVDLIRSPQSRRINISEPAKLIVRESISKQKRSVMKLGPYVTSTQTKHDGTITLTVLSQAFTELMPRLEAFQRTHPHIVLDLIDGHTMQMANDMYWERLQSHRPVPDVFNLDVTTMPQFAASGAFLKLDSPDIEAKWGPEFNKAAWRTAHYAGHLYGLPGDQSQTALFYRRDLLDHYGISVPATWREFYESGVELHRRAPSRYLGAIDSDMQYYLAFLRSAGICPWQSEEDGKITFNLNDHRIRDITVFLQRCIDDGALTALSMWDGRYATMKDGAILTVLQGNWFSKILAASYPANAGQWHVALPPSWSTPEHLLTAQIGGSMMCISARIPRERQLAALQLIHWVQANPVSVDLRAIGGYSATTYFQNKPDLLGTNDTYFNQQVYRIYTQSAQRVNQQWDHLPFETFMSRGYAKRVLPELKVGGHSPEAFASWLGELPGYARSQGFSVTEL
ncbi:extracellular solute-binding protein [Bifidobacterium sp. UBA744]|uniref:extracellular solute-binding protein n=1 Tax=Bifidobacterium sp. UBA744 TaxID=1946112 RepID=UPI0025BE5E4D|nr:extracellular solute-binding protein [Bifidobacterium sp. UBA744]